jgi:hypothetical protein
MAKRVMVHIPQRICRRLKAMTEGEDVSWKGLAVAIMLRALDEITREEAGDG